MSISGVHLPQNIIIDSLSQKRSSRSGSSPSNKKTESFNLHIFNESVKAFHKSQTDTISTEQPYLFIAMYYNKLPFEAFSLPRWSNKWFSDLNVINLDKGMKHMNYQQRQYDALCPKKKEELSEYTYAVQACIAEELIKHGIKDSVDYYTKFMKNDELSDEVHQAVTNCLADNPRTMELMQSFGLSLY